MASNLQKPPHPYLIVDDDEVDEEEDEDEDETWDDWNADENEQNDIEDETQFICLFCYFNFTSFHSLFQHCSSIHHFDFSSIRHSLNLDFYGCFKLLNYIRAMVAQNTCWNCGQQCKSNEELLNHLHAPSFSEESKRLWDDDKFLQPFKEGDALLYSFDQDDDFDEDECMVSVDEKELEQIIGDAKSICFDDELMVDVDTCDSLDKKTKEVKAMTSTSVASSCKETMNGFDSNRDLSDKKKKNLSSRVPFGSVVASDIKKVNESYFGSYSSFGIHREMLSDKVRMDAYSRAILKNPSLFSGAVVMDVGCGTGILSLFAAQAGASRVIAVDGSEKMAAVATQIAKDNGYLWSESNSKWNKQKNNAVIEVVHGMIEDLEKSKSIEPHSLDVLISEWMGYCLLYESMLSSILFARDRWLKPGGAILPDTATMFAAGFGKGSTSLPFWENVYGFDMSSVGKELVKDAAEIPIVDVVNSDDIVTHIAVLKNFDLASMKIEDMDFTSTIELLPNSSSDKEPGLSWCHGVVLWFDTGFTSRFCKEMTANLSTSPYTQSTHWSQTIFTFKEPIAISSIQQDGKKVTDIGTESCPASKIELRVSIVRATEHRAIDISIETSAVSNECQRRVWPVQMFNLS